jgi:hypothetical protein
VTAPKPSSKMRALTSRIPPVRRHLQAFRARRALTRVPPIPIASLHPPILLPSARSHRRGALHLRLLVFRCRRRTAASAGRSADQRQ